MILQLDQVSRRYGTTVAVDRASFTMEAGRIACLLGPSGSGKSTVLRMIAGLEPIDTGAIRIGDVTASQPGRTMPPELRGVGLVFQDNALFPHLDVRGNVGFGLNRIARSERDAKVAALLDQFHIAHLAQAFPHMLSGGEQQRVAIARALAPEPALLLLDEPFSGLDGSLRESVRAAVLTDLRRAGASVLVVTHDPQEAIAMADQLVLMAGGAVLQTGTPEQCYHDPVSTTAARLLGEVIVLPGVVRSGEYHGPIGTHAAPGLADGPALLALRPHAMRIGGEGAPATVTAVRFAGSGYATVLDLAGQTLALPPLPGPQAVGELVRLSFDPALARVFSADC